MSNVASKGRRWPLWIAAAAAVAFSLAAVACGGGEETTQPATTPARTPTPMARELGTTPGWAAGNTGTVFYTKNFFCGQGEPCIVGEEGATPPGTREPIPKVWVLIPLFNETQGIELHCPTAGSCPAHPRQVDVSRIGLGQVIPLPPHSHIVDPTEAGFSTAPDTPWEAVVVGVKTRAAWDRIQAGKSLQVLRQVQANQADATPDIPTNLYLFFGIR
ncbi:hypothetical protein HRbin24_01827 [bacterium HR24]|nr:hypothetical protein HRbin24_01827 [bacterium HR24]